MTFIGTVQEINRYPVKSFAGESMADCAVHRYGLHGDRLVAFYEQGERRYVTARDVPQMLAYRARLDPDEAIEVLSPDGRTFRWALPLLQEIQAHTRSAVAMLPYELPEADSPILRAVDAASVLIITDRSLRKLEQLWGKALDARRFRANVVVTVPEELDERDWIGKRIQIGDAQFRIEEPCERCSMITIDPVTLQRDPSLLSTVAASMGVHFGAYASVERRGHIHVGDPVNFVV